MSQQKLRIGIIGVGMFASYFHVPQLRATGRAEIVAICRRNQEQLAIASDALGVAATYTDWRTMFDSVDLDAVVVTDRTPRFDLAVVGKPRPLNHRYKLFQPCPIISFARHYVGLSDLGRPGTPFFVEDYSGR